MRMKIHDFANSKDVARELVELCPFGAFEYAGNKLSVNDSCRMCSVCMTKGPPGAITLTESENEQINKELWRGICVFAEVTGGDLHPVTLELLNKAAELSEITKHPVIALIMGSGITDIAGELCHYGVDTVYCYDYTELGDFMVEPYTEVFGDFIERIRPSSVLVGATSLGRSLAPRVAARFRTGVTADCTKLLMKEDTDLVQIRPAFGGNIMAEILTSSTRPQFCTVRYKVFDAAPRAKTAAGRVVKMDIDHTRMKTNCKIIKTEMKPVYSDISDARVIVAAGRGIKNKEDLSLVEELARVLKAQVACTRPIVENGWIDTRRQIGLSGRTVRPDLIITCGISGSVQFAAGISGARRIVAINNDKNAQIFKIAHYSVVGDLYEILPRFTAILKEGHVNEIETGVY